MCHAAKTGLKQCSVVTGSNCIGSTSACQPCYVLARHNRLPVWSFSTNSKTLNEVLCITQEAENGRALCEGTVLCTQDRIAIGRIEDTFGPVMSPLYTLRWAGQGDMPPSLALHAPVFTTQKLAEYLLAEQLYTNVSRLHRLDLAPLVLHNSSAHVAAHHTAVGCLLTVSVLF